MVKIKDMPTLDRPRERLMKMGSEILSDTELITILIGSGNSKHSAKDLAILLLKECGGIKGLKEYNYEKITKIPGIKLSKACNILASIELARRMNNKMNDISNIKITNSKIVYEYYKDKMKDLKQECFYCLYLDNSKKVIKDKLLFKGTLNYSLVHPREIFKEAYLLSASAIICVHNHPSGNINPSNQDIEITNNLVSIGNIHGISILDHIIIGRDRYYSFLENEKLVF